LYGAIIDRIRRDNSLPIENEKPDLKPITRSVWSSVKKAIREIDAEKILKFAFLIQVDRVDKLIEQEEFGSLDEDGYKEILVLVAIGTALSKLELGQHFMRAAKLHTDWGKAPENRVAKEKAAASDPTESNFASLFWKGVRHDGTTVQ
jgi:hypothetical protein